VARALVQRGARVTVTDLRPAEQLDEARADLEGLPVVWELGGHREASFTHAEAVVVNPAVPQSSPWLALARQHGALLTTDVNLALHAAAAVPAFAVTGTHGKSTCAALAAHLLSFLPGRTVLAGNLGGSLLERVTGLGPADRLVVELSSFQTETLLAPRGWPRIAALTCLRSDHLDRHGTREAYAAAKRRLLDFQDESGLALVPAGDPESEAWAQAAQGEVRRLDLSLLEKWQLTAADLPFQEPYRLPSLLAAVEAALALGLPRAALRDALRSFSGLPHRMQSLPAPAPFCVVDNGVATHPEPTQEELQHASGRVVLLVGGKDKGLPLAALASACGRCTRIYAYGEGGRRLAGELDARGITHRLFTQAAPAMTAAVAELAPGETLLFSPSFASYDEFRNFRDRALLFQEICRDGLAARAKKLQSIVATADQETRR
jgi:UDP-N-acetylmuramoylalanine--D-glutamate ligase